MDWPGGGIRIEYGAYECGCPYTWKKVVIQGRSYTYSLSNCQHTDGETLDPKGVAMPTEHEKNEDAESDGSSGTTDAFLDGGHEHHDEEE